jgi:ubiquinone/menaquinone biosynthesis C-methylase UbiE
MIEQTPQSAFFFHKSAAFYHRLITAIGYKKAIKHFLQRIPLSAKNAMVLDAGCGTGLVAFSLLEKFETMRIVAFDRSLEMIEIAERFKEKYGFHNIDFFVGDLETINPLRDRNGKCKTIQGGTFDYIFVAGSLEYADLQKSLSELVKFLKKDGTLFDLAVKNNYYGKFIGRILGFKPYQKIEIIDAFKKAKLTNIKEIPFSKEEKLATKFKVTISGKKI